MELLPSAPLLLAFLGASLVLALTPGPGVLYIVARSLQYGRRGGLRSVAGVAAGNIDNAAAAVLGLAALFAVSSLAFTLVKYAGAAYLVWLGIRALKAPGPVAADTEQPAPGDPRRLFRDGFVVALLNPKTTLFFAAFLPQFMAPGAAPLWQGGLLALLFVAIAAITDAGYALLAGGIGNRLRARSALRRAGRRAAGLTYIALGLAAALSEGPRRPTTST
jgi:threonine/homoserine/homoserine lactone efflux protein